MTEKNKGEMGRNGYHQAEEMGACHDQTPQHTHHDAPHEASDGQPPHGWYYFGPQPPWSSGASHQGQGSFRHQHGAAEEHGSTGQNPMGHGPQDNASGDNSDLMEAFDRMSRGDVNAETLGKMFSLNDRDFWKGALVGSAAVLLISNLPALKSMLGTLSGSDAGFGGSQGAPNSSGAANQTPSNGAGDDVKETNA